MHTERRAILKLEKKADGAYWKAPESRRELQRLMRKLLRADETRRPSGGSWTTKTILGGRVLISNCFLNMFKNSSRSLFWNLTLERLRWLRQISPGDWWWLSTNSWSFSQNCSRSTKNSEPILSGPKQSLVKWGYWRFTCRTCFHQYLSSMVQKLSILLYFFNFTSVLTDEWLALVKSSVLKVFSVYFWGFICCHRHTLWLWSLIILH